MHCIERWRNTGLEERKRMFKVFDESGIFIACCQHRFVLAVCDMVQSGELWVPVNVQGYIAYQYVAQGKVSVGNHQLLAYCVWIRWRARL